MRYVYEARCFWRNTEGKVECYSLGLFSSLARGKKRCEDYAQHSILFGSRTFYASYSYYDEKGGLPTLQYEVRRVEINTAAWQVKS